MVGIVGGSSTHRLDHSPTIPTITPHWVLRNGGLPAVEADKRRGLEGRESRQHAHLVLQRLKPALAWRRSRATVVLLSKVRVEEGSD
jgi:hypothetical protein